MRWEYVNEKGRYECDFLGTMFALNHSKSLLSPITLHLCRHGDSTLSACLDGKGIKGKKRRETFRLQMFGFFEDFASLYNGLSLE